MAKITPLLWDSEFFEKKIGKWELNSPIEWKNKLDPAFKNFELIYIFSEKPLTIENNKGLFFMDTKITYLKDNTFKVSKNDINTCVTIKPIKNETEEAVQLGIQSGIHSRFNKDPLISEKFEKLYELWIRKSIAGELANEVLGAYLSNKLAGLVTLDKKEKTGSIGLIAVNKEYRGKGVGNSLIMASDKWYHEKNLIHHKVVTQLENKPACNLYEKFGYKLHKKEYIYHWYV